MRRKSDISQEPIDDLASKVIKYGKDSIEKITFDAKSSIGPCEIELLRVMKCTFYVSKRNKTCGKNPLCLAEFFCVEYSNFSHEFHSKFVHILGVMHLVENITEEPDVQPLIPEMTINFSSLVELIISMSIPSLNTLLWWI